MSDWVPALLARLEREYPVTLTMYRANGGHIVLSAIVVTGERRQKTGDAVMRALIAECDRHGDTLALTPVTDLGATSVARLTRWYRRLGFASNRGRRADHEILQTMVRYPHRPA